MEKLEEIILEKKEKLKKLQYFSSLYFKKIDDKNLLFISEIKDLPINGLDVNCTLPSEKLCAFLDTYIPYYYYCEDLEGQVHIHNYIFSYPKLSKTFENYNCSTLNKFAMFPLETIKSTNDVILALKFNRRMSLNIALLLMEKDVFTVAELYDKFIKVFPKLSNLSLEDFKKTYKEFLHSSDVITRNMLLVVDNLMSIPYIKQNYFQLIIDYMRFRDEENINYLRKIIIKYLKSEYYKEQIAKYVNKFDLDTSIDTVLCRDTLARKLKK